MPEGFPRWQNAAGERPDGDERCICPVCEDELWVPVIRDGEQLDAPCRWCEKGYIYVVATLLDTQRPDHYCDTLEHLMCDLDEIVGLPDTVKRRVADRAAELAAA